MNLEEFRKKAAETDDWAPGWEAIDSCLEILYPGQEPRHFGTNMALRALFGGDEYIDGYSVYESLHGHLHFVTYGMSELYVNEESFGGEWSKWGYEMTFRLPGRKKKDDDYMWALDMLGNLARYTYTSGQFFEPMQYVSGRGNPIKQGSDSKLTGLLIVNDPELSGIDTLYGRLDFLQLFGVMQSELDVLMADHTQAQELVDRVKQDNPFLVTDLTRTKSYL